MSKNKHTILSVLSHDAAPHGMLGKICRASLDSFFDESKIKQYGWAVTENATNPDGYWHERYAFKDNNASILAVAHCDTVWDNLYPYDFDPKQCKVFSPELDDRLGVYIITSLLPRLGVQCDVLLTENEEYCSSTAVDFNTKKKYNWIMEWDRRGAGVVMYQYETENLKQVLKSFDFHIEQGTYSDICDLYKLGVAGFNFATGYANEHTKACFADLRCLAKQVVKFMRFYNAYKDIKLESNAGSRYATHYYSHRYSRYDYEDEWDGYYDVDGKWHYYGKTSPVADYTRYLDYRKCVGCGKTSKVKTAYMIRGKYICPTCERSCTSCNNRYTYNQIDPKSGFCLRCKAALDAKMVLYEDFHDCYLCKKHVGCVEIWEEAWICHDCLKMFFVTCDDCHGVLPALKHGTLTFAAVGTCTLCNERKKSKAIVTDIVKYCDWCGATCKANELVYFVKDGIHLCTACARSWNDQNDYHEDDDEDDTLVDREGNKVSSESAVGYDYCDICEVRDELFEVEGMHICNNCRSRVTSKGA